MINPATSTVPPSSSVPSYSVTSGVTFEAIMEQLQQMQADFGGRLDYLTNETCQMNTRVGHIAHRQGRMAGLAPSPETSLDNEVVDDADSSDDDEMTTSQLLAFCHS